MPLTPLRSIAIDRTLWPYGLPFWIEASLPAPPEDLDPATLSQDVPHETVRRLFIAHDTGSAIVGPARGDLFFGSGTVAGDRAGRVRHPGRFVVLLPRQKQQP